MHRLRGAVVGYRLHQRARARPRVRAAGPDAVRDRRGGRHLRGAAREGARRASGRAHLRKPTSSSLEAERGRIDFVDVTTPPCDHARHRARGALAGAPRALREAARDARATRRARWPTHAREVRRVLFPCHNYKHAPVIKAVRQVLDAGLIGPVQPRHAADVPEHAREGRRGVAPRLAARRRFSGGGIAMDHGSHTFYLAFDWFGAYPTAITAKMSALPATSTPRTTSPAR